MPSEIVDCPDQASQTLASLLSKVPVKQQSSAESIESELSLYLSAPKCGANVDPLKWWKTHTDSYPYCSHIAKKYLSMCATSSSSERMFSAAGNICSKKRNTLKPEMIDQLVFLYSNL
jgi:hypothetical protein